MDLLHSAQCPQGRLFFKELILSNISYTASHTYSSWGVPVSLQILLESPFSRWQRELGRCRFAQSRGKSVSFINCLDPSQACWALKTTSPAFNHCSWRQGSSFHQSEREGCGPTHSHHASPRPTRLCAWFRVRTTIWYVGLAVRMRGPGSPLSHGGIILFNTR